MSIHTVKLTDELSERLAIRSVETGATKSEIIRAAVELFFDLNAGRGANPSRLALVCEYNQLVLDYWLMTTAPEKKDELLEAARERLARHHGG
ncbi:hypothetical protein M2337_003419 [Sphingobium sp. B2D3A]|uniref:hypothetical protein n=1 Tax=unclassified Sphingobium TaxID=2611147 RepID=UPI00222461E8|nr:MULTISPECIES: hypothetical protein [unclassified Sphingobium]MCW2339129.1 hypothetical protein [Sphingobium sp. B2D3A]MCW2386927.1 hypothetical protein [Sphingobium sp. B2D3D]